MEDSDIRYVAVGERSIALRVVSRGERDLVVVNESVLPIEALQSHPVIAAYFDRLASWGRVIVFDRWGVGLSDPAPPGGVSLDDWVDDLATVMSAVGSVQATLLASGPSAGLIALRFARRFPERVNALCLYDAIARYRWAEDYPFGVGPDEEASLDANLADTWGTVGLIDRRGHLAATAAAHPDIVEWAATWFRRGASPNTVRALNDVLRSSDLRADLPKIETPTLIVNHRGVEDGRYLAAALPNARYLELADDVHLVFSTELDAALAAMASLMYVNPIEPAATRELATVLFTDIVGSTRTLSDVGDRRWTQRLDAHERAVQTQIERLGGRPVSTTGDGFVATFGGPTRAVRCALAIVYDAELASIGVRVGVHVGEIERLGERIHGLTVHVTQRVCALASAGQILVTDRLVDLATGSDIIFDPYATVELRGVNGDWRLHTVRRPFADSPGNTSTIGDR